LSPPIIKSVHLVGDFNKALYLDREFLAFRPNIVFIEPTGRVVFEINEMGLKGEPRDPSRKLAVVWGDSVAFGVGQGWPVLLNDFAPGWQFLNGGIEGDRYDNILRRANRCNRRYAVDLNLLMLGWHPFQRIPRRFTRRPANRHLREHLTAFLEENPNTILLTMPTALNRQIIKRDLSGLFRGGHHETAFYFYGDRYSVPIQREVFAYITERNAIAREVCAHLKIPVVDLFEEFSTEPLDDFRRDFFDVVHPRISLYPRIAEAVYRGIKELLTDAGAA